MAIARTGRTDAADGLGLGGRNRQQQPTDEPGSNTYGAPGSGGDDPTTQPPEHCPTTRRPEHRSTGRLAEAMPDGPTARRPDGPTAREAMLSASGDWFFPGSHRAATASAGAPDGNAPTRTLRS
ncbi:hypothetical protein GCM10023222_19230 [Saccharopolyspora cebuensis]